MKCEDRVEAKAVPGIEELTITAEPGDELVPLPEGTRYLGFLLARGETPADVERSLREAHRRLTVVITASPHRNRLVPMLTGISGHELLNGALARPRRPSLASSVSSEPLRSCSATTRPRLLPCAATSGRPVISCTHAPCTTSPSSVTPFLMASSSLSNRSGACSRMRLIFHFVVGFPSASRSQP